MSSAYRHSSTVLTRLPNILQVQEIFRLERAGERSRFHESTFGAIRKGDRRLLWHGSRCTNFGGILSQGLRVAPPEAPATGYMFDKGIYLADMFSKSANYTAWRTSKDIGLLLLCEAELGNPMLELIQGDYHAKDRASDGGHYSTWGKGQFAPRRWKDAGSVHPDLKGVIMPDVSTAPGHTGYRGASLHYNEFICYDVAQVQLRYLFRVKFD